jgi:hypothetical protein
MLVPSMPEIMISISEISYLKVLRLAYGYVSMNKAQPSNMGNSFLMIERALKT